MSNSIAKEKPVTSEDCTHCVHKEVCWHRELVNELERIEKKYAKTEKSAESEDKNV